MLATALVLVALNSNVGRAVFHVQCNPPGGDIPNAASACAAIDQSPELITQPTPFMCRGGPFSWWKLEIRGRLEGQPVNVETYTCWTPQMATIHALGIAYSLRQRLVPRRHGVVALGRTRTFPRGRLRPADVISCKVLSIGVPLEVGGRASVSNGRITLRVTLNRNGSVTTSCRTGKS